MKQIEDARARTESLIPNPLADAKELIKVIVYMVDDQQKLMQNMTY